MNYAVGLAFGTAEWFGASEPTSPHLRSVLLVVASLAQAVERLARAETMSTWPGRERGRMVLEAVELLAVVKAQLLAAGVEFDETRNMVTRVRG